MTDESVSIDPYLRELVEVLLNLGSGIGFTFFMGDHVVFGSIITADEYDRLTDELIFEAAGIGGHLPGCHAGPSKSRQKQENDSLFLHLSGVTVIASGGQEIVFPLLRVRMSEVLGWSLGAPALVPVG
jgi:hypothetical protein